MTAVPTWPFLLELREFLNANQRKKRKVGKRLNQGGSFVVLSTTTSTCVFVVVVVVLFAAFGCTHFRQTLLIICALNAMGTSTRLM